MSVTTTLSQGIEQHTRQFLEAGNAKKGPQIFEIPVDEGRKIFSNLQESVEVKKLPVDIEDKTIPVGPGGQVKIRIVRPQGNTKTLPVVLYSHGGGWVFGDTGIYDRLLRDIACGAEVAVVFVDFSRSPEAKFPTAIEEIYAAAKYVSQNADKLNVDARRFAVAGDSVGGNMTAVLTMLAKERGGVNIAAQVLFYPVTQANFETASYKEFGKDHFLTLDGMKWFWNQYLESTEERKSHHASPLNASLDQLKGLPPALVITAEFDVLRDEGEAYAHRLIEAGVAVEAVRCLGTIHDFVMLNPLAETPAARCAIALACNYLRRNLSTTI